MKYYQNWVTLPELHLTTLLKCYLIGKKECNMLIMQVTNQPFTYHNLVYRRDQTWAWSSLFYLLICLYIFKKCMEFRSIGDWLYLHRNHKSLRNNLHLKVENCNVGSGQLTLFYSNIEYTTKKSYLFLSYNIWHP